MQRLAILMVCLAALAAGSARAEVTYSLGTAEDLLDAAFYAGDISDNTETNGRFTVGMKVSCGGTQIAFAGWKYGFTQRALFVVNVGDPSSWRPLSDYSNANLDILWTPDDSAIISRGLRIDPATGDAVAVEPFTTGGLASSFTSLPSDNWAAVAVGGGGGVVLVPVLPNGEEDFDRSPVWVTNFNLPSGYIGGLSLSRDGTALTFGHFTDVALPAADLGDVYALLNLEEIIAAPTIPNTNISSLAPPSLADPSVIHVRAEETSNYVGGGYFSEDKSLVFLSEDFNNAYNNDNIGTVQSGDWDNVIARSDGTGTDYRIMSPGQQFLLQTFPGGARFVYNGVIGTFYHFHLLATTLQVGTSINGTDLGNNDIETTETLVSNDGSGTAVEIPPATVVNFPTGEPQEIQITTPIDPIAPAQLPTEADAMPVVRIFGPDGTTFNPPIGITITYTDAEIAGLNELTLRPYLFNEGTQVFDIPVADVDILDRDIIGNKITFRVSHFSTYGLAAQLPGQEIEVTPLSADFVVWPLDAAATAPQTITIANTGTDPLNFTGAGIAIGGTDPGSFHFSVVPSTAPILPGGSREVQIAFQPIAPETAKSATLTITTDDPDEPSTLVALTGTASGLAGARGGWDLYE